MTGVQTCALPISHLTGLRRMGKGEAKSVCVGGGGDWQRDEMGREAPGRGSREGRVGSSLHPQKASLNLNSLSVK